MKLAVPTAGKVNAVTVDLLSMEQHSAELQLGSVVRLGHPIRGNKVVDLPCQQQSTNEGLAKGLP